MSSPHRQAIQEALKGMLVMSLLGCALAIAAWCFEELGVVGVLLLIVGGLLAMGLEESKD